MRSPWVSAMLISSGAARERDAVPQHLRAGRRRWTGLVAISLTWPVPAANSASAATRSAAAGKPAAPVSVYRADIPASFAAAVCRGEMSSGPQAAWRLGVYDAQLEGRIVARPAGLPISQESLAQKAHALAELRGAGGYAYGFCPPQGATPATTATATTRGWVMALPAPAPVLRDAHDQEALLLPHAALRTRCSSFRVDFAAAEGGAAQELFTSGDRVNTGKLARGVVSLTCQPKAPRWQGPVLWDLVPVGAGPFAEPPEAAALSQAKDQAGLRLWVNRVRAREHLPPLAPHPGLDATASNLLADDSLAHNRALLASEAKSLRDSQHSELLSEDRVKGGSPVAIAWLLWNSPRHRESLLRRDATAIGIASRDLGGESLAVLLMGMPVVTTTARGHRSHSDKGKTSL